MRQPNLARRILRGGGRLVAAVTDPDGNVLGLLQDRPMRGLVRRMEVFRNG